MLLTPKTTVLELVDTHPYLIETLADYAPAFAKLRNPLLRNTVARVATLQQAADLAGMELTGLMAHIARAIMEHTGEGVTLIPRMKPGGMPPAHGDAGCPNTSANTSATPCGPAAPAGSGTPGQDDATRLATLKELVLALHNGADPKALQARFASAVGDISGAEIARLEQTLVAEGLPEAEIKRLCTLHVDLFKGALDHKDLPEMPAGHPVHTYVAENAKAAELADDIIAQVDRMHTTPGDRSTPLDELAWSFSRTYVKQLVEDLAAIGTHYTRKENQLFPLLEAAGIEAPPKVMWEVHDDIRAQLRTVQAAFNEPGAEAAPAARAFAEAVKDMIYKEEKVLFPMALETLDEAAWSRVRHGEDEIGYAWVTPGQDWHPMPAASIPAGVPATGSAGSPGSMTANAPGDMLIPLATGALSAEVVNQMLRHLPVDLSFVDANDKVAYYSDTPHRIFPRSAAVIGRNVSNCHPPKSVHMVEEILARFKAGERDEAAFWIELGGRFLHIRYFAVRSETGTYMGCLEVSQDVTDIRALTGQRRLLEWT